MEALSLLAPDALLNGTVRIQLVGCGGTGSQIADQLARIDLTLRRLGHPGFEVELWDHDKVSPANIGRQRFTSADIGYFKSILLAHRINVFHGLDWRAIPKAFSPTDTRTQVLITATDSALFRARLGAHFVHRPANSALWLDLGNGASTGQIILGHLSGQKPASGSRLPNVFDLHPELADMAAVDREQPSCSVEEAITRQELPINQMMATCATTLLWNLLRHGRLDHHGCFIDSRTLTVRPLRIDPQSWAMYGYNDTSWTKRRRTKKAIAAA